MLTASFALDSTTNELVLDSFDADQRMLVFFNDTDAFTFFLPGGNWQGTDQPGLSGAGTERLNVNEAWLGASRIRVGDSEINPTLDVVFANEGVFFDQIIEHVDTITQLPNASVSLSGHYEANRILLSQPGNDIRAVDIFARNGIDINALEVSVGTLETSGGQIVSEFGTRILNRLVVPGRLEIESGGDTEIFANQIGVTGHLKIVSNANISIDSFNEFQSSGQEFVGNSQLRQLTFNSRGNVDIAVDSEGTPTAAPVVVNTALIGENRAQSLNLQLGHMKLFDHAQSTLSIVDNAKIEAAGLISLADSAQNVVTVGRGLEIDVTEVEGVGRILVQSPGDVRVGWIRSSVADVFVFSEDDSTLLSSLGDEQTPLSFGRIESAESLFVFARARLLVDGTLELSAAQSVLSQFDVEKRIVANRVVLNADRRVALDGFRQSTSINFAAVGDVTLRGNSNITLFGTNSGNQIDIETSGRISMASRATLEGHSLKMSGQSVWMANFDDADEVSIGGRMDLQGEEGVIVGTVGQVSASHLSFDSPYVNIVFAGNMHLVETLSANRRAELEANRISDGPSAIIDIENVLFRAKEGIYLGDGSPEENVIHVCGKAVFDASGFVVIGESADVVIADWGLLAQVDNSINVDSTVCRDYEYADWIDEFDSWDTESVHWTSLIGDLRPSAGETFWGSSFNQLATVGLRKSFDLLVEAGTYTLRVELSAPFGGSSVDAVPYEQFTRFGLTGISSEPISVDAITPEESVQEWTTWTIKYSVVPGSVDVGHTIGFEALFTAIDYTVMIDDLTISFDAYLGN